jgi:hypothetical protein
MPWATNQRPAHTRGIVVIGRGDAAVVRALAGGLMQDSMRPYECMHRTEVSA